MTSTIKAKKMSAKRSPAKYQHARAYAYGLSGGKVWEVGSCADWMENFYEWSDYDQLRASVQDHGTDEALVKYVWDRVMETATFRKRKGRKSAMTEPFWALPEKYAKRDLEANTLDSVTAMLEDAGYMNIKVQQDGSRVTLSFNW